MKKEALLLFSNICAGPDENLLQITKHSSFVTAIKYLKDEDFYIKNEAIYIIKNVSDCALIYENLLGLGVVEALVSLLEIQNPNVLQTDLETLDLVLVNERIKNRFDEAGGIDLLEKLQKHPNLVIYYETVKIMDKHYGLEEVCLED